MDRVPALRVAHRIRTSDYNDTLEQVRDKVDWKKQSCTVVCDEDDQIFGVISEGDILEAEKNHVNLKATQAWEICSHNILSVEPDEDIHNVIDMMLKNHIHHVLVKGGSKKENNYVGIISTMDILKEIEEEDSIH